jgi:hypothetical protein
MGDADAYTDEDGAMIVIYTGGSLADHEVEAGVAQVGEFQSQGCYAKQSFAAFMEERAASLDREAEQSGLSDPQRLALRDDAARIRGYLKNAEQPEDSAGNYNSRPDVSPILTFCWHGLYSTFGNPCLQAAYARHMHAFLMLCPLPKVTSELALRVLASPAKLWSESHVSDGSLRCGNPHYRLRFCVPRNSFLLPYPGSPPCSSPSDVFSFGTLHF